MDTFLHHYIQTFDTSRFQVDPARFIAEARAEFEELCSIPEEDDMARLAKYAIKDAVVADYRERTVRIDAARAALVGIRFSGGDKTQPFIAAWPNYSLSDTSSVRTLATLAEHSLRVFAPKSIQVFTAAGSSLESELLKICPPRRRLYVGDVQAILKGLSQPSSGLELKIAAPKDASYYARYLALYKDLHCSNDPLDLSNLPNDREDLDSAHAEGLLWEIFFGGESVGFVQAEEGTVLGETSLYISDIIIHREHRGKGLGPHAQIAVLRRLGSAYRYLFGHILETNTPSISAALKLGRQPIRSEFLVPLEQLITV